MTHGEANWIKEAPGAAQRIEASFKTNAFSPHRHDTYAIGITMAGVQTFDYRGQTRHSQRGQMVVLHPDELHDGRPGTSEGFRYRLVSVSPSLVQGILGGKPLPFVENGTSDNPSLRKALTSLLGDFERPLAQLEFEDGLYEVVTALSDISGSAQPLAGCHYASAKMAREYIDDSLSEKVTLDDLEHAAGRDRWALSRDFRSAFGTSPYRYLTLRRLDNAKRMIREGVAIADAAFACEFSDQSHFTRHFKKAFGMTPDCWRTIVLSG